MKIKTLYVYWRPLYSGSDPYMFVSVGHPPSRDDDVSGYQEIPVNFEIIEPSPAEQVNAMVKSLRKEQGDLHAKSVEIDRKINELLALEAKDYGYSQNGERNE